MKQDPGLDMEQFEVKLFLQSSCYAHLEESVKLYEKLILKDGSDHKFDIESENGQKACSNFLKAVQRLCIAMSIKRADRSYIERFSKAYKILYKNDNTVFLPEIFDSAQEGYSYLWVNGEKYVFSEDVLQSGKALKEAFCNFKQDMELFDTQFKYKIESNSQFREVKQNLNEYLEDFDKIWTTYEKNYILELMVIEADSRRYVQDAIDAEKELSLLENNTLDKSRLNQIERKQKIRDAKVKLVAWISKINSVANTNGKGRDDLSYEIFEAAVSRKKEITKMGIACSSPEAKTPFDRLFENIEVTLTNLRILLSKYAENIEVVDPQLKNNSELVEGITDFENVWSKGKLYLMEDTRFRWFIVLSQHIDYLINNYQDFKNQVEWRDYEMFMVIPSLVIQKACWEIIQQNSNSKGEFNTVDKPVIEAGVNFTNIIHNFSPNLMKDTEKGLEISCDLTKLVLSIYEVYSFYRESKGYKNLEIQRHIEQLIIQDSLSEKIWAEMSKQASDSISLLKPLSIELQRSKPSEWNELLDICIQ